MVKTVISVVAGALVWILLVTASDRLMRHFWPDYASVFTAMNFTLPMMIARLTESTVALIAASYATVRLDRESRVAPWALGVLMLAFFAPFHYTIWDKFPIWYHAYFLASLIAVPLLVARTMQAKPAA
jgi:hypothetical protein